MTDTLRVSSIAADVLWQRPAWDALITDPPPAANPEPRLSEGIYLVEVTAVTDGAGSTTTLRFTDSSLAYATRPAEVPPNAPYNPALISPGYIERAISVGAARVALGEILIASAGGLDYLLDLGLDGQAVIIRRGPHKGVYPDDFPIQLRGTMEQPEIGATQVRLRLRDRMSELEKPLQAAYYGGTNALPDGIDGTADDIKGRAKPRIYGKVRNVEPVQVNTAKLIWQVNDGPIASVPAVYVRGAQLTGGAVYADLADLYANAPAPGTYRAWLAGGLFRLGSSPDGQVTCDATETASLYAGTLIQRIAEDAGIDPADISAADAAALDAAAPYALGVAVTDGETALSALARVAASVGAWHGFDRFGTLRCGRLESPAGTPITTLDEVAITRLERTAQGDLPAWRVTLRAAQNHTVQTSDLAGSVSASRRAWLAEQYRQTAAEDPSVKTLHRLAGEITRDTALDEVTDAATEAARLLVMYGAPRRDTYAVSARLSARSTLSIDLGQVVNLVYPRYGLDAGKLMVVIGVHFDFGTDTINITLWG